MGGVLNKIQTEYPQNTYRGEPVLLFAVFHAIISVGHVSLQVVNVTWIDLEVIFYPPLNQFWIACRLVYSMCEAMTGSLSVVTTAVSSAKVTVVQNLIYLVSWPL